MRPQSSPGQLRAAALSEAVGATPVRQFDTLAQ
jgi:hypothetical protein